MGFKCGIIGLPNVGKSTLFNALTESNKAEAANYPFATIEPNVGRVAVPDQRLEILGKMGKSEKIIPSYMDFVDIAGLVKGASKGEGLGNAFLSHIRSVNALFHIVRCFEDSQNIKISQISFLEKSKYFKKNLKKNLSYEVNFLDHITSLSINNDEILFIYSNEFFDEINEVTTTPNRAP